jgi:hypothetical protein
MLACGYHSTSGIQPDAVGAFVAFVPTLGLAPGKHQVEVKSSTSEATRRAVEFDIKKRNDATEPVEPGRSEAPFGRELDLWRRRFSNLGYLPSGILAARQRDLQRIRRQRKSRFGPLESPVVPGCNWTPMGPGAGYNVSSPNVVYTGKIHAIAIDPTNTSTVCLTT